MAEKVSKKNKKHLTNFNRNKGKERSKTESGNAKGRAVWRHSHILVKCISRITTTQISTGSSTRSWTTLATVNVMFELTLHRLVLLLERAKAASNWVQLRADALIWMIWCSLRYIGILCSTTNWNLQRPLFSDWTRSTISIIITSSCLVCCRISTCHLATVSSVSSLTIDYTVNSSRVRLVERRWKCTLLCGQSWWGQVASERSNDVPVLVLFYVSSVKK